jgi:predicted nucleic acid-binding Zn ribbon protein
MISSRSFVFFGLFSVSKLLNDDGEVIKFMEELSLMKKNKQKTRDVILRFMLQIYVLIVMMTFLKYCFVIAVEAIGYVINSVGVVEFLTYIFNIV